MVEWFGDGVLARGPLPDGLRPERSGAGWVIRHESYGYWCDVTDGAWADELDEYTPTFVSDAEARSAYLRADRMYGERAVRHRAAAERLGLEE